MIALALVGLAAPVAAQSGDYNCTVLVGTELATTNSGPTGVSASNGAGECELHTLDERSRVVNFDVPEGCAIFADTDGDEFVERAIDYDETYDAGTTFIAFCEIGVTMAENQISLHPE